MTGYEYFENKLKEKGLKAFDVSKGTGIRSGVFSDWKAGRYTPKADKMKMIADFLGCPVEPLLGVQTNAPYDFYIDKQTIVIAQKIYDNPDLRMLFEATDNVPPQDLKLVADMVKRLKRTNGDE